MLHACTYTAAHVTIITTIQVLVMYTMQVHELALLIKLYYSYNTSDCIIIVVQSFLENAVYTTIMEVSYSNVLSQYANKESKIKIINNHEHSES